MSGMSASLTQWFSTRPQWLQIAATRLLQQPELTDKDVSEFATLCQQEAEGKLPKTTCSFPATAFSPGAAGSLRLCSISDVEGVNALAPKKPLEFGKGNITIVYGNNGSGKSGYVRLLKHVCGARERGTLHRNVYKPGAAAQKACISFELDGVPKSHTWSGQGICDDLNSVDIFDTSFGKVFVSSEDEVSYEPPVLSFFSSLILACEKVASALDTEANRHQSKKPNIPADKKATPEGIWYEAISAKTSTQDIDKHCAVGSADETEMQTLQQRLAEQAPAEKAKQLRKQKQHIDTLVQDAKKYLEQLSDENYRRIIVAKKKWILKKTAADTAAQKVFSGSELEGIGSDVWKELWEAARNYSVSAAYKETEYPNVSDGSRCVLCHQILTQEAKERLISFENFVKGEMQKAATDAAKEYETANQTIEALPTSETLKTRIDAAGIPQDEVASQVTDFFAQLQARKDLLPGIDSEDAIPDPLLSPKWIEEANAQWTNKDRLPDHMLRELIEHFSSQTLSLANCPEDELGVGYEFLIKKFADDSGHTAAEFYTNRTVVHLMTEMLEPKPGESIYDPTCGSAGMLLSAVAHLKRQNKEWRNLRLFGQERNLLTSAIGRMNLFLHGIEDFRIVRGDTLANPAFVEGDRLMQFDVVLANPPYSIKQWDRDAWSADPWGRNIYGTPPRAAPTMPSGSTSSRA